jgi:PhzF family phenazine biosynthesis protein
VPRADQLATRSFAGYKRLSPPPKCFIPGNRMADFKFQQVDVFTSKALLGNPLAVVLGADTLTDVQMAAFANWTNLSETTFILKPTAAEADYRVRIFTPQVELGFAGHPTLGTCHAWLTSGGKPKNEVIVQECGIGLVKIRRSPDRLFFAAPKRRRSGSLEADILLRVCNALRLPSDAVVAANWVDNGPGWLAILLRSRGEVLALRPDYSILSGLRVGVVGAWDLDKDGPEAQFEVRAFTAGGYEDAVTGSLNAGLAQWLIESGIAPPSYIVSQGTAMRRMGRIHIEHRDDVTWVGGAVTSCISGHLSL